MKIVLTVWNGRVAPVFDVAGRVMLIEKGVKGESEKREFVLPEGGGSGKLRFIRELNPDVFICGAVSRRIFQDLGTMDAEVHTFVSGSVEDVMEAVDKGILDSEEFIMPGCKRGFCRRKGGQGRGAWIVREDKRR